MFSKCRYLAVYRPLKATSQGFRIVNTSASTRSLVTGDNTNNKNENSEKQAQTKPHDFITENKSTGSEFYKKFRSSFHLPSSSVLSPPVLAGWSVAACGASYVVYKISYGFASLTPIAGLYFGFYGGIITGCAVGACAVLVDRALYIRPETVEAAAKALLQKNGDIKKVLGGSAAFLSGSSSSSSGSGDSFLTAFRSRRGGLTVKNGRLSIQRPEVELVFGIQGVKSEKTAVGLAVATKSGLFNLHEHIDFCGVDIIKQPNKAFGGGGGGGGGGGAPETSRILIKGDESQFKKLDAAKKQVSFIGISPYDL